MKNEEMSRFEEELGKALRRVEAPGGFADLVMARAEKETAAGRGKVLSMRAWMVTPRVRVWAGGAMAAMLALGVFVGEQVHVRHEREQAAVATQQFEAAMRIENQALERTRMQLERAGIRLDQ